MESVAFDRATEYYDSTRALPPETLERILTVLTGELAGGARCLEIGAGTGRFSLPLHGQGVDLFGADLSLPMLNRLVTNAGGVMPFPVAVADATDLPYDAASFTAALACHVLHLIPAWRRAAAEVLRVLRPGGVFLVDFGGAVGAPWTTEVMRLMAVHGVRRVRPGVQDPDQLAAFFGERARLRPLAPVEISITHTLDRDLVAWEQQLYAWTWPYSPEQMAAACADVRAWAEAGGWPLHQQTELTRVIQWWAYDVAG